jgi:hypothetical protein
MTAKKRGGELMANRLNIDLQDKTVVVLSEWMAPPFKESDERERSFHVEGGFGTSPTTIGRALLGYWVEGHERGRIEGYMVEKLADEQVKE